ncbi:TPA: hypothetical protein EYO77_16255, partial [Candidatus Poribacteria bacterium]|nr:hypothetical protein [Candidatus Poribacteria bacterium]
DDHQAAVIANISTEKPHFNEAKFRKPVVPGDQLRLEVEVIRKRRSFVRVVGKTLVGSEVASEGDISIMLGSNQA